MAQRWKKLFQSLSTLPSSLACQIGIELRRVSIGAHAGLRKLRPHLRATFAAGGATKSGSMSDSRT
jgi:hypothetical protein